MREGFDVKLRTKAALIKPLARLVLLAPLALLALLALLSFIARAAR